MRIEKGVAGRLLRACVENKLVMAMLLMGTVVLGLVVSPFDIDVPGLPRSPVLVDAIPDLGENQQIVFTEWLGRSPQDVDDQITYPLTSALLGMPGVSTIRSQSHFGFSSIYVIFEDGIDFYWSRARILEQLGSLPPGSIPVDAHPKLGPDATALGQVFWYTLEGQDVDGQATGGWGLEELRHIQDWQVRQTLLSAVGVSEVAGIGGFVEEYHIEVDADALRVHRLSLEQVMDAARRANLDVGARTIEVNGVEYVIRGLGLATQVEDLAQSVVAMKDEVPIRIGDVAQVVKGPALRRGVLDKAGVEAVGGVVVVRQGFNPREAIDNVKAKIAALAPGLPAKALVDLSRTSLGRLDAFAREAGFAGVVDGALNQGAWTAWLRAHPREFWPAGVTLSQVTVVPFYDRAGLIEETLATLREVLTLEVLITMLVILFMLRSLGSAVVVGAVLPVAVLITFIVMRLFDVTANVVALAGIAIAIGTLVDLGIIVSENIRRQFDEAGPEASAREVVVRATREVAGAAFTSVATTVVSFLPVFALQGAEGKLFTPLAFTKTSALLAAFLIALALVPLAMRLVLSGASYRPQVLARMPEWLRRSPAPALRALVIVAVGIGLALLWRPLGPEPGLFANVLFVALLVALILMIFRAYQSVYPTILAHCLRRKWLFLALPLGVSLCGLSAYTGFDKVFGFAPDSLRQTSLWQSLDEAMPGLGSEFMPALDEGAFLYMPTTMPHASIGEAHEMLQRLDAAIASIPEVSSVVGKLGRVDSALDPAPISMFEILIHYLPEYRSDSEGKTERTWRPHIESAHDIWQEILDAAQFPSVTSAPKLQPISTRLVMLQSGLRAPFAVKITAASLEALEAVSLRVESIVKDIPSVRADSVFTDRLVGKPYLEIEVDRDAAARYGLRVADVLGVIEVAVGGSTVTTTTEGRARHAVRVRYPRERRDSLESLSRILVPMASGEHVPLGQVAEVKFVKGPQVIKSEDSFLVDYVTFDKQPEVASGQVANDVKARLDATMQSGELVRDEGVSLTLAGEFEQTARANARLAIIVPLSLVIILAILYLQFSLLATSLVVFSGIVLAWAGGFLALWCYGLPGFLDFSLFGVNLRDLFQIGPINMSVAVWVGFLALFGIATDNGVVTATYLDQSLARTRPESVEAVRSAVIEGATRRIRPALMTTATTLIALLPLLSSQGRGSDIMVPMAIPTFGGMLVALIGTLLVPVLYSAVQEWRRINS